MSAAEDQVVLAGHTTSGDFPITPGAYAEDLFAQAVFVCHFSPGEIIICPSLIALWHREEPGSCMGQPVYSIREYIGWLSGICTCPE